MTEEKRNRREREFISLNGAIMESLCLVKSHEITTVTASAYSTAEREETQRAAAKLRIRAGFSSQFFVFMAALGFKRISIFRQTTGC